MELTIDQALQQGIAAHKEGKLQDAERLYRAILQSQPSHPDANHNLGVLAVSINKADSALPLFKTAIEANPNQEQFWLSYVDALIKEQQFDGANQALEQAKKQGIDEEILNALEKQLKLTLQVGESQSISKSKVSEFSQKNKNQAEVEKDKKKKEYVKDPSPTQQQVSSLVGHYQNRRFSDVEKLAVSITKEYPKYPFAYKVLGAVLKETGRITESLTSTQRSIQLEPEDAGAYSNLGNTLQELGRLEEAKASCRQAIALKPDLAEAHYNLGITLNELGRLAEAETSYRQAVMLNPNLAEGHGNLGVILKELGRLEEAEVSYRQAIALRTNYAEAHYNLGVTLNELGRLDEAEASYKQAIALSPDYAEAHSNVGDTLQDLGRLEEAEVSYRQAIALKPDHAKSHNNFAMTLQELGRLEEAEASYRQAIALKPDLAEACNNFGTALKELGRLEAAEKSYTKALMLKPNYVQAHRYITEVKNFAIRDAQYCKMRGIYLDESTPEEQLVHINFGLAKACEDLEDFEQAFVHYSEGNALRKKLLPYDINRDVVLFKQIESNYPQIAQNFLELAKLSKDLMPIFVVGMPRSGTTLVEQILSSHSQITGAGELAFVNQFGGAMARGLSTISNASLREFRENYLKKLRGISYGNSIVTDKMPLNFRFIGLLTAAFPEAKIIHVKRNPAAVCWANYKQFFVSETVRFCYALEDVITYYRLYESLMKFWENSLEKRIYNLDYELLVRNQESETRQLIGYLDLDWDEKCLSPQNNKRRVATASTLQVREKVYQGSSEQWKKYKPFLDGVFDDLLLR